jgi:hypothetical protein
MLVRTLFVAAFIVLSSAASAQTLLRVQLRGIVAICARDYERLCPGVPPGGGRIIGCLNSQAEKLSQPCFQALAEQGLGLAAALRLCRADFERLCPGVPAGQGRGLACLLDNRNQVSPGCDKALSAHGYEAGPGTLPRR